MDDRANLHVLTGTEEERRAEALRRGLVPVPPADVERVNAMSAAERRDYLKRLMAATRGDPLTEEAARKLRNKRKAERRSRRGK